MGILWWKWKDIKERPGVESLLQLLKRKPIRKAHADRLTIAVARLAKDKDREHENLLADELEDFEGVETLRAGRLIGSETLEKAKADKEARSLLKKNWGRCFDLGQCD